jgi:hypothetical protein
MIGTFVVWSTILLGMLGGMEVAVSPLTGPTVRGELVQLSPTELSLARSGTTESIRLNQLRRVEFAPEGPSREFGPIQVHLTDGSVLRGKSYTVAESQATLSGTDGAYWTIPTRAISRVLFRDHGKDDALRSRWETLAGGRYDQDTLVYRRETDGVVTLDTLQGVLYDVRADGVDFLFDGERITPRLERVEGLVYFHPTSSTQPAPTLCIVQDLHGSRWQAARLTLVEQRLEVATVAGVQASLPLSQVQYLDFTAGNLVYLSDLAAESAMWRPFIESRIAPELLERRYAPRRDEAFDGGRLRILGESYEKGLGLRSQTTLVYRVGSEFRRFQTRIGMDDLARNSAVTPSVMLTVSGDDKILWEGLVSTTDAPVDLDLEITGVRRLKIMVDFGDDLDIADFLNLADARFTK